MIDDLVGLVHPLGPQPVSVGPHGDREEIDEDAYAAWRDDLDQYRRKFDENLRTVQDAVTDNYDFDPLISEISRARRDQREAEDRLRLLLAYAREFTPRPYPLADLAEASGMSPSGVRTAYTQPRSSMSPHGSTVPPATSLSSCPARPTATSARSSAGSATIPA